MGRTGAPGSVLTKTILVKSLQKRCSDRPCSYQNQVRTIVAGRQNNAQTIEVLGAYYTSGKACGSLVLQATLPGVRGLSAFICFHYIGRSNPSEEIGFL